MISISSSSPGPLGIGSSVLSGSVVVKYEVLNFRSSLRIKSLSSS